MDSSYTGYAAVDDFLSDFVGVRHADYIRHIAMSLMVPMPYIMVSTPRRTIAHLRDVVEKIYDKPLLAEVISKRLAVLVFNTR